MAASMTTMTNYPLLVCALTFVGLGLAELAGKHLFRGGREHQGEIREFGLVMGASLTLLGLIIGFSFSMATSRYDQRKNLEAAEANAIGTEYVRADFLPATNAARVRTLLRDYVAQRTLFYGTTSDSALARIDADTARLQDELWAAVRAPAEANPTPLLTLVVGGMNDVLNSQGFTQAAWWNRIPAAAWGLMAAIAVCCSWLVGYGARRLTSEPVVMLVLPLIVSISFFLIADIDSPRGGVIRVEPKNLVALAQSLRPR
jgi:hypothetical protein